MPYVARRHRRRRRWVTNKPVKHYIIFSAKTSQPHDFTVDFLPTRNSHSLFRLATQRYWPFLLTGTFLNTAYDKNWFSSARFHATAESSHCVVGVDFPRQKRSFFSWTLNFHHVAVELRTRNSFRGFLNVGVAG